MPNFMGRMGTPVMVRGNGRAVSRRPLGSLDRLAGGEPILESALIVLADVAAEGLGDLRRAGGADAGRAGEHDSLALRQREGIEGRKRMRERSRDVPRGELVRLAHVDEGDGAVGQSALDRFAVEI